VRGARFFHGTKNDLGKSSESFANPWTASLGAAVELARLQCMIDDDFFLWRVKHNSSQSIGVLRTYYNIFDYFLHRRALPDLHKSSRRNLSSIQILGADIPHTKICQILYHLCPRAGQSPCPSSLNPDSGIGYRHGFQKTRPQPLQSLASQWWSLEALFTTWHPNRYVYLFPQTSSPLPSLSSFPRVSDVETLTAESITNRQNSSPNCPKRNGGS